MQHAGEAHVSGGVTGADQGVTAHPRKTVVSAVAVLVGIAEDASIYRATAAYRDYVGKLPVVEKTAQQRLVAAKGTKVGSPRRHQPMALISHAWTFFRIRRIGILY